MSWCRIPCKHERIFGKFEWKESSYCLYLSDLAHVWTEIADKYTIIEKADQSHTLPIDVSSNTVFLLKCLTEVIYNTSSGDKLELILDNSKNPQLKIQKNLQPLPEPLQWTFDLKLADTYQSKQILEEFVYSLLNTVQNLALTLSDLYEVIAQKDYHLKSMNEVLANAGGVYNPRIHKHQYLPFDQEEFEKKHLEKVSHSQNLVDCALATLRKYSHVTFDPHEQPKRVEHIDDELIEVDNSLSGKFEPTSIIKTDINTINDSIKLQSHSQLEKQENGKTIENEEEQVQKKRKRLGEELAQKMIKKKQKSKRRF